PSPSGPVFPRRAPSGCSATNGPLVDESHRKTRRPPRRAARRAATAPGRATTLAERPGVPSTGGQHPPRPGRPGGSPVGPVTPAPLDGERPARRPRALPPPARPPSCPVFPRRAPSGSSATNGPLGDESHRNTRRPRRRAARRAATALGRATTLAERPGVPSTGAERLQRHQRPSRRRVTPENPPPSTSSGPARGYGARPRHHPRRAARCSLDGRRAAAAPPTALSAASHTGTPAALDVLRPGARLRRSAAPPPSPSGPVFPRRAPSGCSATNGPLVDESHRKTRRPRRRAARRAATALGRATTLAERPGVPSTGAERLQRHQRPSRRRVTPENPPPSTSSGPARGYGARPRHHPRRAARCSLDGRRAAAAPPTALSSTSHTGKPAALAVGRPGARRRRPAAPPPSPSGPVFPRRAPSGCSATNGPLVDESHRKTRRPRRRAARRAATALGRATTLAERPGVPSTGAERLQRHQRPSRRRVTPENPPPSASRGPARGYGARPRHHSRRAARCSLDGRRAAAAPPTALSSTSHTGKP